VTANISVDPSCQYGEGSFPHFKGFGDSIMYSLIVLCFLHKLNLTYLTSSIYNQLA
jgi:hypothetical protein